MLDRGYDLYGLKASEFITFPVLLLRVRGNYELISLENYDKHLNMKDRKFHTSEFSHCVYAFASFISEE